MTIQQHIEWGDGHDTLEQAESVLEDIFLNEPVRHRDSVFTIIPIFTRL